MDDLIDEFYVLQDLNGDGMIYGYDFMIKGDDKPPALKDLEASEYWKKPKFYIPSWSSYLNNNIEELTEY